MRISDWSSDVCSSDLIEALEAERRIKGWSRAKKMALIRGDWDKISALAKKKDSPSTSSGRTVWGVWGIASRPELVEGLRSEERRVGKECVSTCRSRWWTYH